MQHKTTTKNEYFRINNTIIDITETYKREISTKYRKYMLLEINIMCSHGAKAVYKHLNCFRRMWSAAILHELMYSVQSVT